MIDCHLHLQEAPFRDSYDLVLKQLRSLGVTSLGVNGTRSEDWDEVAKLAKAFPEVVPFFGIHPWFVKSANSKWADELRLLLESFPNAGVGEVGLDKWIRDHDMERQSDVFLEHLAIAEEFSRPVAIHCLQAWGTLLSCLEKSPFEGRFLLHSFGGPVEMVKEFVDQGAYFSLSGYFFRPDKKDKLETFATIPEDRILLETDSPDMLPPAELVKYPWPSNGEERPINHPANIETIYAAYADWRGLSVAMLEEQTKENFSRFLDWKPA